MKDLFTTSELLSEPNHTKLFSQAPAPIAIYKGRELRYVFVNEAYSKIFNHRDILGKTVREAFPELEGQSYFEVLENVFDSGNPFFGNETPALVDVNNDGNLTTRYYNLVYTPYRSTEQTIEGVMAFGHDVTEQVEARRRERDIDLRFRNIVEQSTEPILILKGPDLILEVANEALLKLWNVQSDAIGKSFLEILPEMKEQGFFDLLQEVYQKGITHYGHETPAHFKRSNGKIDTRYFNFIYQPYREADQSISGVLILATDVTGQVLAKQQLSQSELNFRNTVLQAPVAMCVLKGSDNVVEIANQHMYELWGKHENEIQGKPLFIGLPEAKGQGFEQLLSDVYTTGRRFEANERPIRLLRNGKMETVYVNFVYEGFRAGNGKISGIIAVATEVTSQVEARLKVEFAEENARLAIETADLGTYEINLVTNEMITSKRFKTIWGLDFETNNREDFASLIHPDDLSQRQKALQEVLSSGSLHFEVRVIRKDLSQRWIKVKGKVLYDKDNTPLRLLGIIQDVTDQKLFAEELAKQVEERTRALMVANKNLERTNEELEQFAYIASHDLQEPLRKIQLFNSLVLDLPDITGKAKTYIEKVSGSAVRMAGLIRDLLDYSRLSQKIVQFEKTDLNIILQNVVSDYEVTINQKKAVIKAGTLPVVQAIPLQMNQILFNLIGNALKFTKRDVIPVINITSTKLNKESIKAFERLKPGREYYEIKISDNGIGFNQEYADKIFTIFQKLNEKSMYGGYGIGLALCRKIVSNHSGIIYAEGKHKEGATFTFILPCKQTNLEIDPI